MFGSDYREIEETTNGIVFNIEHFHVHDGEGIRTNVFLKGCNLHCPWCCNPESISLDPQIAFYKKFCTGCGKCREVCRHKTCISCGECIPVCPLHLRRIAGEKMTSEELILRIRKSSDYYARYGGGVTFSGGEPLMQADLLTEG